jgi:Flp pilus assembly secretin CpaC
MMSAKRLNVLSMRGLLCAIVVASLMPVSQAQAQSGTASQVAVEKDQSLRIRLKGPAGNIIVTNPRIADVTVLDSHTLYIIGRGVGTSGVTVTDTSGRTLWEASVLVSLTRTNAVTLFRGTQPVVNVCLSTCVEVSARGGDGGSSSGEASPITVNP